jgi:hypothetical protein
MRYGREQDQRLVRLQLSGIEDYEVAVGVGEGYGLFEFDEGDLFFVETA